MQILSSMSVSNCPGEGLAPSVPIARGAGFLITQSRKSAYLVADIESGIAAHRETSCSGLPFELSVVIFALSAGWPAEFREACQTFCSSCNGGFDEQAPCGQSARRTRLPAH